MDLKVAHLLKQHFDRRLNAIKREHDDEIAKLRAEMGRLAVSSPHSHQREYEALTTAWEHFSDAAYATRAYMLPILLPRDLSRLDDNEVSEFLNAAELTAFDVSFVIKSANRNAACVRVMMVKKLSAAETAIWQARRTVRRQSVFIPVPLTEQFEAALSFLQTIQAESRAEYQATGALQDATREKLVGETGETWFADLRKAVRSCLLP